MKAKNIIINFVQPLLLLLFITGCASNRVFDKQYVSDKIKDRSGFALPDQYADSITIPGPVVIEDGLTEDESVSIALWNSPGLQVDLSALGFARADLVEARMLPNPVFSLLFPLGPKQLEFTLSYYADILWQKPGKIAVAKLNAENVAENLVQHGLSLIREVNISFADLVKAGEEYKLLEKKAGLDAEIEKIAAVRLESGDISGPEEAAFRLAASQEKETFITAGKNMATQKVQFLTLLGLISDQSDIKINPASVEELSLPDQDKLIEVALAFRPDMRASEIGIEIAGKKLGWERSKILNLTVMLDANGRGTQGFEMGPGMQFGVPILNFNKGGRVRAKAEMQRAAANYILVQQSIRSQVMQSYQEYVAAKTTYDMLKNEILPVAEKAAITGESAYMAGEISYLEFLEFRRQAVNAQLRFYSAEADVRKSLANLYFSLGGKLSLPRIAGSSIQ